MEEAATVQVESVSAERVKRQRGRVLEAVRKLAAASAAGETAGVTNWEYRLKIRMTTLANLWFKMQFGVDIEKVQVVEDVI